MKRRFVEALTLGIPVILIVNIIPKAENVTAERSKALSAEVEELTSDDKEYALGRIIVKYKDGVSEETINTSIERKSALGVKTLKKVEGQDQYRSIFLSEGDIKEINGSSKYTNLDQNALEDRKNELRSTLESYLLDPNVEYAQPVYIYRHNAWNASGDMDYPQDFDWNGGAPEDGNHWYYDKENVMQMWQDQNCDTGGANCGGSSSIVVAVIDSGLAVENRTSNLKGEATQFDFDIASEFNTASGFNRYENSSETNCTDGDDDDGNGYIDDCRGYNAYEDWYCSAYGCTAAQRSEQGHPNDDYGHGTYVTGLIASNIDNAGTSVSPAHNVTIMPIKASERITHADYPGTYGPAFYSDDLCNALDYARLNGADVINMSLGGNANDLLLKGCIKNAYNANITLVAASGNDDSSVDYPAKYSQVIAVGAATKFDNKASYSNYGTGLDIVAMVGTNAYQQSYACFATQTCHNNVANNFKSFNIFNGGGTSYASPQVAAAAALMKGYFGRMYPSDMKIFLTRTATNISGGGWDNETGYGVVDFEAAWNAPTLIRQPAWITTWGTRSDTYRIGDFDGDGNRDDILQGKEHSSGKANWYVKKSTGSQFSGSSLWRSEFGNFDNDRFLVGDFTGDGKDDLLNGRKLSSDTYRWYVLRSTGSSFILDGRWITSWGNLTDKYRIGDFDGDGNRDDILQGKKKVDNVNWYVKKSNGSTFGRSTKWKSKWGNYSNNRYLIGDFNHDGKDDLLNGRRYDSSYNWYVIRSTGSSFTFLGNWASSWGSLSDKFYLADFDHDNYIDDMLQGKSNSNEMNLYVKYSSGNQFIFSGRHNMWVKDWGNSSNMFLTGNFDNDSAYDDIINARESGGKLNWYPARTLHNSD